MKRKVNKNEFLSAIAEKTGLDITLVKAVYTALVDEIRVVVCRGEDLSLTGFGSFTLKKHKGHPVQFEAKSDKVKDYVVLKFAASDVLMSNIRHDYANGDAKPSDE
jgi:nucleoid DNA-binding protein